MPTGVITSAKSKLYVSPGLHLTATNTLSEYDALTGWIEIGDVVSYGEFGATFEEITHQPINDGLVYKFKGSKNSGSLTLNLGRAPSDAGQARLIEATDIYDFLDFKLELNDLPTGTGAKPTRQFFYAQVMSYTTNIPNANSIIGATCTISISGDLVEGAKVVGS